MTDEDLLNEMEAAFDEDDDDDDGAADESTPSNGAAAASSTTPLSSSSGTPRQTVQVSSNFGVVLPPSGDGDDDDFGMPKSKRARTIQDVDDPTVSRQSSTAEEEEDEEGDVYINGINVVTGELIENEQRERGRYVARTAPNSRATKLAYGSYQGLELSKDEINRIKGEERAAMLSARKLVLVLDLDHTLLNSATVHEMTPTALRALEVRHAEAARAAAEPGAAPDDEAAARRAIAAGSAETGLHVLEHIGMWTKLRPGLAAFLAAAAERYELYVYTMGARRYAWEMAALIDPLGTYGLMQKDRVIAKEDSTCSSIKSLDVVLGSEETVVIVDDTLAVWQRYADQVLVPRRYHFFDSSARRDAAGAFASGDTAPKMPEATRAAPAAAEEGTAAAAEEPPVDRSAWPWHEAEDTQLEHLSRALAQIHDNFFAAHDAGSGGGGDQPHARKAVAAVRRRILDGVTVLFTGVIPLHSRQPPEKHHAWRLAVDLGAKVVTAVGPSVTHVVAGRDGTDKVRWGRGAAGVRVVTFEWLARCGHEWRRVDERGHESLPAPERAAPITELAAVPPPQMPSEGSSSAAAPGLLTSAADVAARIAQGGGGDDDWLEGSGEEEE